ncbi:hypothetical protein DMC25_16410 [Caulobacter sp. D4A]|uniref:hypothetical protein n=1 Tax=unclassified Caulobacter TaxID=2648921 RepID=UPI000D730048|nr:MULTISPECIES: hypothetical protein [unclassified Caulobacter]PXA84016.1 hypothetical protein DMC18_24200 [Caulobacter sp. D5]PXA84926.1 hypothetical protein DMC25_16410 [Caulobacter sp. D4A]
MTWRYLTTRDPVLLKGAADAPAWLPPGVALEARVVAILGPENDAPLAVQLDRPLVVGFDDDTGLHLTLVAPGAQWLNRGAVDVRRFRFPQDSPALREGVASPVIEGRLTYERRRFEAAEVFAEAEEGGGTRMLDGVQLALLVEYARTRDAAVTFVETFELQDAFEIARIDLSLYGLEGNDAGLTDEQRIDLAAGYVSEVLALCEAEGECFGYRAWVGSNADR